MTTKNRHYTKKYEDSAGQSSSCLSACAVENNQLCILLKCVKGIFAQFRCIPEGTGFYFFFYVKFIGNLVLEFFLRMEVIIFKTCYL